MESTGPTGSSEAVESDTPSPVARVAPQVAAGAPASVSASGAFMSQASVSQATQGSSCLRQTDSDDDSPIKPRSAAKSKLLSDSDDDVPVKPSRSPLASQTAEPSERKYPNGTSSGPPRQRARSTTLAGSTGREGDMSDSSSASDSSSDSSSSGRSNSSVSSSDSGSSDSSDELSSDSGNDSEDDQLKKPRKKERSAAPKRKQPPPKKQRAPQRPSSAGGNSGSRSKSRDGSDDDENGADISMGTFDPRNRTTRAKLVAQLLCRWWYVLPDWPPADFDYVTELTNRRLKLVTLEEYEDLDDVDEQGFTKVYQISAFPGVFRDPNGKAIDLRPAEGRPCYSNFIKKSEYELLQLVETAIKNQLEKLKESVYDERRTHKKLQAELSEVSKELQRHRLREDMLKSKKIVSGKTA
ncbi:conserved hypothetical protein [Neospora caninum Liverpool]|uniref:Uncharacterized protein n=1 Tax=Neospora caninum (strain Liverpool) TaxID=572307 RepID=F0VBP5_NEOCL|nr:conserved hypothetical protein [Neospora caninum Liverpool]CBZ51029.1 conserved hypothetical protein [Neospora caninum Liverpool]CEL68334.1 TPA: hypothetical protein BN1204_041040 [Neospora caninum Liverpool]|eukprot:XP_003881062.1 conserved hypothetical protein [Neospora caninum Liverpool]